MAVINVLYTVEQMGLGEGRAVAGLGGIQTQLIDYAAMLQDTGRYRVVVCCLRQRTPFGQDAEARGLDIVYLHRGKFDPRQLFDIIRIIRRRKIQIVHTHLFADGMLGRLAAMLCHVPCIVMHDHIGTMVLERKPPVLRWIYILIEDFLSRFTHRFIAVSQPLKEYRVKQRGVAPQRVAVIHTGIDIRGFQPELVDVASVRQELGLGPSEVLVGTVGRLFNAKGHRYLIQAAAELRQQFADVRFVIVGEGSLRGELEEQARLAGVGDALLFAGFRQDIPRLLAAMDIYVLPSLWEGLPVSLLEAMAMGRPVIATRVGGIPELVVDGQSGILIPPADLPALVRALDGLLRDGARRETLGRNARQRVQESFSVQAAVDRIEAVYAEVLGPGAIGP